MANMSSKWRWVNQGMNPTEIEEFDNGGDYVLIDDEGKNVLAPVWEYGHAEVDVSNEHAALIAMAPEMLAALTELAACVVSDCPTEKAILEAHRIIERVSDGK